MSGAPGVVWKGTLAVAATGLVALVLLVALFPGGCGANPSFATIEEVVPTNDDFVVALSPQQVDGEPLLRELIDTMEERFPDANLTPTPEHRVELNVTIDEATGLNEYLDTVAVVAGWDPDAQPYLVPLYAYNGRTYHIEVAVPMC